VASVLLVYDEVASDRPPVSMTRGRPHQLGERRRALSEHRPRAADLGVPIGGRPSWCSLL